MRKYLLAIILSAAILSSVNYAEAARWTVVDFGADAASTIFNTSNYPGWNIPLKHATSVAFTNPDGIPEHMGLVEATPIGNDKTAYFGIMGSSPINFQKGQKISATFYNTSAVDQKIEARVSFTDTNEPASASSNQQWYTMYDSAGSEYTSVYLVKAKSFITMDYYITDDSMKSHRDAVPSAGSRYAINLNLAHQYEAKTYGVFVLTKIEISDEVDLTKPTTPANITVAAKTLSGTAGATAIELSWDASSDPGNIQSGISRYLVYRDGSLYDVVSKNVTTQLGGRLTYGDINVAPEKTYTYQISALDNAPFGMYPSEDTLSYRTGNESILSQPLSFAMPASALVNSTLINPNKDWTYLGAFRLPNPDAVSGWDYARQGLTHVPSGNKNYDPQTELPGSLYGYGHSNLNAISEITIPKPKITSNVNDLNRAKTIKPFALLWPSIYFYDNQYNTKPEGGGGIRSGLAYVPAKSGFPEKLYYTIHNWYAAKQGDPFLGYFSMDLSKGTGAWSATVDGINALHPGLAARYIFLAPQTWADQHTGGRSLLVGNSGVSGLGGVASKGPTLYALAPWEGGGLPNTSTMINASKLLEYEAGYSVKTIVGHKGGYANAGGAWLTTANGKQAVVLSDNGKYGDNWYGDGGGNYLSNFDLPNPRVGNKGNGNTFSRSGFVFYNPNDLAKVAAGQLKSYEVQPYLRYDISHITKKDAGSIAYDEQNGYLYLIVENGDPGYTYGRSMIHVFKIGDGVATPTPIQDTTPPAIPSGITVQ